MQYRCTGCTKGGSDNVGNKTGNNHFHVHPTRVGLIQVWAAISKVLRLYQRQPLQYEAVENATDSVDQGVQCSLIPVGVQSLLQDMIWRHAQHVHNAYQQIMLGSSRE